MGRPVSRVVVVHSIVEIIRCHDHQHIRVLVCARVLVFESDIGLGEVKANVNQFESRLRIMLR